MAWYHLSCFKFFFVSKTLIFFLKIDLKLKLVNQIYSSIISDLKTSTQDTNIIINNINNKLWFKIQVGV